MWFSHDVVCCEVFAQTQLAHKSSSQSDESTIKGKNFLYYSAPDKKD